LGENKIRLFPSVGIAYKVVENKDGIVNDFKIRNFGKTGNQDLVLTQLFQGFLWIKRYVVDSNITLT
jgi:hypothetical protein